MRTVLHKLISAHSQQNSTGDMGGPSGVLRASSANAGGRCVRQSKAGVILASWVMIIGDEHWPFREARIKPHLSFHYE